MEVFVIIGIIWAVIAFISYLRKKPSGRTTGTIQRHPGTPSSVRTKRDPSIYRPSTSTKRPTRSAIKFRESSGSAGPQSDLDIKDLVDALTGASLTLSLGLYQCQHCKVFYQDQSVEVIRSENDGRCVSCLHAEIVSVAGRHEQRGCNADVSVISLQSYQKYVGHVITFEGQVHTVLISRRGTDYAVMFENQTWTRGFKMVVFRGCVEQIGGTRFLLSLVGHKVRVRGLLIKHKRFGYEIIISDRAMILGVQ